MLVKAKKRAATNKHIFTPQHDMQIKFLTVRKTPKSTAGFRSQTSPRCLTAFVVRITTNAVCEQVPVCAAVTHGHWQRTCETSCKIYSGTASHSFVKLHEIPCRALTRLLTYKTHTASYFLWLSWHQKKNRHKHELHLKVYAGHPLNVGVCIYLCTASVLTLCLSCFLASWDRVRKCSQPKATIFFLFLSKSHEKKQKKLTMCLSTFVHLL